MSEFSVNMLVPAGVVIAALVAGAFSFLNLILTKEQQISQLRQNWIDALREDVSKYIAALVATEEIYWAISHVQGNDINVLERSVETKQEHQDLAIRYSSIMMRLNPTDKSLHQKNLRAKLKESKSLASEGEWKKAVALVDGIREEAQGTLKEEWERVKVGEPSFIKTKRVAIVAVILAVLGASFVSHSVLGSKAVTEVHQNKN
jgi:septum formation topological specificity factor MinE